MNPSFTLPALWLMTVCTFWPVKTGANTPLDAVVPPNAPRSDFKHDIGFGKDPFFPKSTRRPKVVQLPDKPLMTSVPGNVALKGISVFKDKKLAIINDRTLAEGEEFTLKNNGNGQPVKVKCVEIKEKSVIVSVGSATKELTLPTGY